MGIDDNCNNFNISKIEALTFDDVLIQPCYTNVDPINPDTKTNLSKNISMDNPFISSPMPDVSGPELCIKIAQLGGIGFLHRNYDIKKQVNAVNKVKEHEGYIIENPITVNPETTVGDLKKIIDSKKLHFSSFPVVDSNYKLVGLLSHKDFYLEHPNSIIKNRMDNLDDLILVTKKESRDRNTIKDILKREKSKIAFIIDDYNTLEGIITGKDFTLRDKYPEATRDEGGRLRVGAAIGVNKNDLERANELYKIETDAILIDISQGYCKKEGDMIAKLRKEFGDEITIGGGNVATPEAVEYLFSKGVDFVRIGIGAGSICSTRVVLGVGVPQLHAILSCSKKAHELKICSMADGGIKQYGDVAKAIAAGADTVMMGSMFAGVEETPSRKVMLEGKIYKEYSGMASRKAILDRESGGASRYMENLDDDSNIFTQGVEGYVEYRGKLENIIFQMTESLKRSMASVGAANIKSFMEKSKFLRISDKSSAESHPSVIMKEQPENYFR